MTIPNPEYPLETPPVDEAKMKEEAPSKHPNYTNFAIVRWTGTSVSDTPHFQLAPDQEILDEFIAQNLPDHVEHAALVGTKITS
jgi:hypothetical protein